MNTLTLTLIRVAFLAVLWLFVIAAIGVVRTDLFGTAVAKVRRPRNQAPPRPAAPSGPSRSGPAVVRRVSWSSPRVGSAV